MAIYWSTYMVQWNCTPRREFHRGQEIVEMLSELGVEAGWKHWNKVVVSRKAPTHAKYDQNGLTNAKWWFSLGRYIIYSGHFAEYNGNIPCIQCSVEYSWIFNSLRHSAGPLAFGLQAQSRGCVELVGVKGWFDDGDEDADDEADDDEEEEDDDDHRDYYDVMM